MQLDDVGNSQDAIQPPPSHEDESHPITPPAQNERKVLILVGLIGSGKSTFAEALQAHLPHFRRCSQDELGDRRAVEALARSSLRDGLSVCIDRTNVDPQQRSTWVRIAREFPGTLVWVLEFDTPYEVCAQRIMSRTSHPTITSPELGLSVLQRFRSQYQPPKPWEGFDQMLSLPLEDQPADGYSEASVLSILDRLRQAPRVEPTTWRPVQTSGQVNRGGFPGGYGQHRGGYGQHRGGYEQHQGGSWTGYAPRGGYHPRGHSWASPPQQLPWQSRDKDGGTGYDGNWRRPQ